MPSRPDIHFHNGQLYSTRYDDIYYSCDDGPTESAHVFLGGNDLPGRWQNRKQYSIVETGFGTGLNFLVTLRAWQEDRQHCTGLDFYSIEAYPLSQAQLRQAYAPWPQFADLTDLLIAQYPPLDHGVHTLLFADGKVRLHLIFKTLEATLSELPLKPDSWYLDGFAPSKNPSMWQPMSLLKMAACSSTGTSLATFTAAGEVRRNLEAAGFSVQKRPGFGRKREMLVASISKSNKSPALANQAPWFATPVIHHPPQHITVIGAGIAGAQTAWHLAQRGCRVKVLEQEPDIAQGASGNPAGILAPRLTASPSDGENFYLAAFVYQLRQIRLLQAQGQAVEFSPHGLLQIAHKPAQLQQFQKLAARRDLPEELMQFVEPEALSAMLEETIDQSGVLIKAAGALSPRSLCKALLNHPLIKLETGCQLHEVERQQGVLSLRLQNGSVLETEALVLANGHQATTFCKAMKITPVRGQTSSARLNNSHRANHAVDHDAYLLRMPGDQHEVILGASYLRGDTDTDLREAETTGIRDRLAAGLPNTAAALEDLRPAHAGIRATTPDRWPVVGPLADKDFYLEHYADLHQGKHYKDYPVGQYKDGVYVLSGLGSRGLSTAGYCANLLSCIISGTSPPAPRRQLHQLHPARFLIRALKKGRDGGR